MGALYLGGYCGYRYQYAFVILLPDLETGPGYKIKSLGQTADTILGAHQSTVAIARDILNYGNISSSILSIERSNTCLFILYIGLREFNNSVETAARLFPAETSMDMVKATQMTFRPPIFYWDKCGSFSLVVSKGQRFDPLPGESGPRTIFSVSLYISQGAAEPGSEDVSISEREEASGSESEETTDSEGIAEVDSKDVI